MLYNIKISALKLLKNPLFRKIGLKFLHIKDGDIIRKELIARYAPKKSFVDIGSIWRVNGLFSFFAEECGAKEVLSVDIIESDDFWKEKKKRNSKVVFLKGDIHLESTIEKIGRCDVVFCSGVLYHSPYPVFLLKQLRKICKETLILITMTIPEIPGIKNGAVFYPYLSRNQKRLWSLHTSQRGINKPFAKNNEYANWFWGLTPTCITSMLKYAGFKVKQQIIRPFQTFFICQAS